MSLLIAITGNNYDYNYSIKVLSGTLHKEIYFLNESKCVVESDSTDNTFIINGLYPSEQLILMKNNKIYFPSIQSCPYELIEWNNKGMIQNRSGNIKRITLSFISSNVKYESIYCGGFFETRPRNPLASILILIVLILSILIFR
jgi:hypothetical protein